MTHLRDECREKATGKPLSAPTHRMHIPWNNTVAYRCLIAFIGLIVTPFVSGAQVSQSHRAATGDAYTLEVNVNMVILSATVVDRHNALVSGLDKDDFQVYEDGILQQIKDFSHEDIPVTAGILVDNSGSMAPKRDDVIAAALAFARASNPQDQMFVVNFNDRVSFGLPAEIPFTDRPDQLQRALSGIRRSARPRSTTELPPPSIISSRATATRKC
jgi:hypothetical protein